MAAIAAGGKEINFDKKTIKDKKTGKTKRFSGRGSKRRIEQDEEPKKSSAPKSTKVGDTRVFIESDAPEDIGKDFGGQQILSPAGRAREQKTTRAKKEEQERQSQELVGRTSSEIPDVQVQRKYLDVVTSPKTDEREFLKSVAPRSSLGVLTTAAASQKVDRSPFSPEFKMFAEGKLEVDKQERKTTKSEEVAIGTDISKEITSTDDVIRQNLLSSGLPGSKPEAVVQSTSDFKMPSEMLKDETSVDIMSRTFQKEDEGILMEKKEEKTMRLVPTEQEKIRQKDIQEQQKKFENTVQKQQQLNREIQTYMSKPEEERSVSKGRELLEKSKDIETELKINPYVKETGRGYEFTGQVLPDTVVESKSITTTPTFLSTGALARAREDSITKDKIERTLKGERGEFLQGYYSYLQGDVDPLVETAGTRTLGEEGKLTAGAFAGSFAGATGLSKLSDAGKGDIGQTKFLSQPLKEAGISDPYAERIAKTATFGSRTSSLVLAASPVVAAASPTVASATAPTLGRLGASASAKLATKSAFTQGLTKAGLKTAGAGLLVVPGVVKTGYGAKEGFEETGTVKGAVAFGGLSAAEYGAELGAIGSLIKTGVTSTRAAKAAEMEKQAASFRRGENIDVVIQKGTGTDVISKDIVRSVSESEGFAMVGNKKVPIKVYTGAEGKQTVILPETAQEGLRVTGGKIKIEFPPTQATANVGGTKTNVKLIPDKTGGETIKVNMEGGGTRTIRIEKPVDQSFDGNLKLSTAKLRNEKTFAEIAETPTEKIYYIPSSKTFGKDTTIRVPKTKEVNLETDIDFVPLSSGNVKSTAVVRDVKGDEFISTGVTRQTPGFGKESSLDETVSFMKPRTSGEITDMYKTTAFRKPVGTAETPGGTVKFMESEFVTAGVTSKPGSSIQGSIDEMLGFKPSEGLPTINIITPKRPASVPKVSQTEGVKSPISQFDDILKTPTEVKTPIGSRTPKVESGVQFQARVQKPVSKYQQQISQTQSNIASQRVKSFVGEMESTNILDDLARMKSAPIRTGAKAPITTLGQLSEYRMKGMEQARQDKLFRRTTLDKRKQEDIMMKGFLLSPVVLKDQSVYKTTKTDTATKTDTTFAPITTQIQSVTGIGGPPSTTKTDRPIVPLMPGFPSLNFGSGSSMFGGRGRLGTKVNPLGRISDAMGSMFKKK